MEMVAKERTASRKMAAHAFAHGFLTDLIPSVYEVLFDAGYFHDPVVKGFFFNSLFVDQSRINNKPDVLRSHVITAAYIRE